MRSTLPVLAATLLLAAGTGCAGDDDPSGSGTTAAAPATTAAVAPVTTAAAEPEDPRPEPPADQSRWARQVDAACAPVQRRLDALPPPTDAASLETWVENVLPLLRDQIAAVKAVKPPAKEDEARRAGRFVESLEDLEAALARYREALGAQDAAAIQAALVDANAAGSRARATAVSLDVTGCGGYGSG